MTVALTKNFLTNARGLTFQDANGVTWSFNKNTNQVTASVSGAAGGTVTSVGLSEGSTTPIFAISGSPVIASGTLAFTLKTQSANTVLAGPATGAAAQPTFRALVAADIQSLSPTWGGSNTFTNAITVNGAGSALKGGVSVTAPAAGVALTVNGVAGYAQQWLLSAGAQLGVFLSAGAAQIGSVNSVPLQFFVNNGSAAFSIATTGAITVTGTFAINNGTPTAALAGFGTPSGTPTSGLTNAATLAQTAGTLAALLAYLKTIGFITT